MTNAFTRGLKRLFGVKQKPKESCCSGCMDVEAVPVKVEMQERALTTEAPAKKVSAKKPVSKKTVKKVAKKKVSKKAVKKTPAKKKVSKKASK